MWHWRSKNKTKKSIQEKLRKTLKILPLRYGITTSDVKVPLMNHKIISTVLKLWGTETLKLELRNETFIKLNSRDSLYEIFYFL